MIEQNYKSETITNLACVLTNKDETDLSNSDMIVTHAVTSALIPWHKKDEIITKQELSECIKEYVVNAVKPYGGSHNGYMTHVKTKWMVFSSLFGIEAANSLENEEREVKSSVTYDKNGWKLTIPGMKQSNKGWFYDDRMLKWCRQMAPLFISIMPDEEMIEIMAPAYCIYGKNQCRYNLFTCYEEKDFKAVYTMALESISINKPELEDLTPDDVICQLEWCIANASNETAKQYIKDKKWNDLCSTMQEAWDDYINDLREE